MTTLHPSLRLFISFAPADEDLLKLLVKHLRPLVDRNIISVWSRMDLRGGDQREERAVEERDRADVVVPLVSSDYLSSEYREDVERASERRQHIVPILLRPCAYHHDRLFRRYTLLPHDGTGTAIPIARNDRSLHDETLTTTADQLKLSVHQLQDILRPEWSARQAIAVDNAAGRRAQHANRGEVAPAAQPMFGSYAAASHAPYGGNAPGQGPVHGSYPAFPAQAPSSHVPVSSQGYGRHSAIPAQAPLGYVPVSSQGHGSYAPVHSPLHGAGGTGLHSPSSPAFTTPPLSARRGVLPWMLASTALLACGILVFLLATRSEPAAGAQPSSSASGTTAAPARSTSAPAATAEGRCCGGLECLPPAWDVRGTYCEKYPGQCHDCSAAGRSYIGGSCSDHLAPKRPILLRVAYGEPRSSVDQVCVRLTGTFGWTCTDSPATTSAMSTRLPIQVADIIGMGRGIDIELRSHGAVIASRNAARTDALSTAMLCVGLTFYVGSSSRAVFYLDDP